ncbi:MAG: prepilin-type N-terminal cleavage/methylation domain-containing protein [Gemmatimonadota bacterium]
MRSHRGFSAVELVVALVVLAAAVAGLRYGATLRSNEDELRRARIERLATERLRAVLTDPDYDSIERRYDGIELRVAGMPGYVRTTRILHRRDSTDAGVVDFKRVTVTIEGPALDEPVVRSAVATSARVDSPRTRIATPDS